MQVRPHPTGPELEEFIQQFGEKNMDLAQGKTKEAAWSVSPGKAEGVNWSLSGLCRTAPPRPGGRPMWRNLRSTWRWNTGREEDWCPSRWTCTASVASYSAPGTTRQSASSSWRGHSSPFPPALSSHLVYIFLFYRCIDQQTPLIKHGLFQGLQVLPVFWKLNLRWLCHREILQYAQVSLPPKTCLHPQTILSCKLVGDNLSKRRKNSQNLDIGLWTKYVPDSLITIH